MELDHLAICAGSLEEGVGYVEKLLGVPLSPGGEHLQMGTHNRLLSLGPSIYLEVIAINPEATPPDRVRWFDLDRFTGAPRLTNWVARCDDLERCINQAPPGIGDIMALKRGDLRWRMAVPENGQLPYGGAFPGLITWEGTAHPAARLKDCGCRLLSLELFHRDADGLHAGLAPMMGADLPRITNSSPPRIEARVSTPSGERLLS